MILTKCYIENFGKHKNFTYDFKEGLNTIIQDNGWGKSTLAVFVKAMFYGMPATRKSNLDDNDRKKYMPWQSGNFGGYIEFKVDDNSYRLERYFGKKEADDTFKLYNLETNKESFDFDENIGMQIFGVDAEAYERSTFIPQKAIDLSLNESISTKLTNVIHGTDNVDGYEGAIELLNARKREIKNNQNRGKLPEIEDKIYSISQDIQEIKRQADTVSMLNESLSQENAKVIDLERECNKLKSKVKTVADNKEKLGKIQILNDLKENEKIIDVKLYKINQVLGGKQISRADLDNIANKENKLTSAKSHLNTLASNSFLDNKYNALNEYFKGELPDERYVDELIKKSAEMQVSATKKDTTQKQAPKKQKTILSLLMILMAITLISGILICRYSFVVGMILFVLSALLSVVGVIFSVKNKRQKSKVIESNDLYTEDYSVEICKFIEKYEQVKDSLVSHLYSIKTKVNEFKEVSLQIQEIIAKIKQVKAEIANLDQEINLFFGGFNFETDQLLVQEKINQLRQIIIEQESLIRQQNDNKSKIATIQQSIGGDVVVEDQDISLIQSRETELVSLLDESKANRLRITNEINKCRDKLASLEDKELELAELTNKKSEYEKELKLIKLTNEFLDSAKDSLSSKYLSPMKNSFDKYMDLVESESKEYLLDTNLNVSVLEYGKSREVDYLSKGYKSIVDMCVRFALIDTLFENEKPFIVLDDPFVNLDKNKMAKVLELLSNVSKEYQIIYLTCHESRV